MQPDEGNTSTLIGWQVVTVKPWNCDNPTCGDFDWTIKWRLKTKAPPGGATVIQRVSIRSEIWDCKGNRAIEKDPDKESRPGVPFWEAWYIPEDKNETGDQWDDQFKRTCKSGNCEHTTGWAVFEGHYIVRPGGIPLEFVPGAVPEANGLPSTYDKPLFWDSFRPPFRKHTIYVRWDCCCECKSGAKSL